MDETLIYIFMAFVIFEGEFHFVIKLYVIVVTRRI